MIGKNPFFSIIIPTYNRSRIIENTILSVLNQTFNDFEILIIDDGSTDNTFDIINKINDPRINYHYQRNSERSIARNNGAKKANGKYYIFLDSDDLFSPIHLEKLYNFIKKIKFNDCLIISGHCTIKNGVKTYHHIPELSPNMVEYFFNNPIIPARVCISAKILQKNNFNKNITIVEDSVLWSDISVNYPVYLNNNNTVIYNIHENNSVNIKNFSSIKRIKGLKIFFKTHTASYLSKKFKNNLLSRSYYNLACSYDFHNKRIHCVYYSIISIFYSPISKFTKSILFLILKQIPGFTNIWSIIK